MLIAHHRPSRNDRYRSGNSRFDRYDEESRQTYASTRARDQAPEYEIRFYHHEPRDREQTSGRFSLTRTDLAWLALGLPFLAFQIYLLYTAILWTTQGSNVDTSTSDFAIFKNTHYSDCLIGNQSTSIDCISVFQYPLNYHYGNTGMDIWRPVPPVWPTIRTTAGKMVSCDQGYCQEESLPWCAFAHTGLSVWFLLNWQALLTVYAVWSFRIRESKTDDQHTCEGMGLWSRTLIALDVVSAIFWWVKFFQLAANVAGSSPVSIINWFTPWRYIDAVMHHPISCQRQKSRWRNYWPVRRLEIVITNYMFLQWALTIFALVWAPDRYGALNNWIVKGPNYDCAPWLLPYSPGTSNCTVQQICEKEWLRIEPAFAYKGGWNKAVVCYQATFIACSILVGAWVIFWGVTQCLYRHWDDQSSSRSHSRSLKWWSYVLFYAPVLMLLLLSFVAAMLVLPSLNDLPARESSVNYDLDCQVVHVGMSPWHQYFDVDSRARAWRVITMWFNA